MMKFLTLLFSGILSALGVANFPNKLPLPLPTPLPITSTTLINYNSRQYALYFQKISAPEKLTLIPNFSEKATAAKIAQTHGCTYGVNAGFYTTDRQPLGIFYAQNKYLNPTPHRSALTNGFVYKTHSGEFKLSVQMPDVEAVEFLFQAGPLFTPQTKLNIASDKPARRILLGQTEIDEFYFLALTEADNVHSGPLLADLPQIIDQLNKSNVLHLTSNVSLLVNLDGGVASAFITPKIQLEELTPIGSFLCRK